MISVDSILKNLGIEYQETGSDLRIKCIFHDEKVPSFSIRKEDGIWYCFSCGESGNIFTFLKYVTDLDGIDVLKYLKDYDKGTKTESEIFQQLKEKVKRAKQLPIRRIINLPKNELISDHPYLSKRGLTTYEIMNWNMRLVIEGAYKGWILIPIFKDKSLRTYFMRDTIQNRKRYGKFPRKDILVGMDDCVNYDEPIYIVEGIFDMIFLRRVVKQAVAALSNRVYPEQLTFLKKFKHVVVVPDGDNPGLQLVNDLLSIMWNRAIGVCSVPAGKKDTAECTNRELLLLVNNEQPVLDFICGRRYLSWKLEQSIRQTSKK